MTTTNQSSEVNAKRVASLLAGFDLGNPCDNEAMNSGLALRRLAAKFGTRIVDLLELPEVRKAVDDQMGPKRFESHELEAVYAYALELEARFKNDMASQRAPSFGAQCWVFEVTGVLVAIVLMLLSIIR
jgi:hypothetical protein